MFVVLGNKLFTGSTDVLTIKTPASNSLKKLDEFIALHKGKHIICFISYELKNSIETLSSNNKDQIHFPVIKCIVPSTVETYKSIDDILKTKVSNTDQRISFEPSLSKTEYESHIKKIKDHIQIGDIYETNFCYQWSAKTKIIKAIKK